MEDEGEPGDRPDDEKSGIPRRSDARLGTRIFPSTRAPRKSNATGRNAASCPGGLIREALFSYPSIKLLKTEHSKIQCFYMFRSKNYRQFFAPGDMHFATGGTFRENPGNATRKAATPQPGKTREKAHCGAERKCGRGWRRKYGVRWNRMNEGGEERCSGGRGNTR